MTTINKKLSFPTVLTLLAALFILIAPSFAHGQGFGENQFGSSEPDISYEIKSADRLIIFKFNVDMNSHITDLKNNFFKIEVEKNDFIQIQSVNFPKGIPYGEEKDMVFKGKFDVNVIVKPIKTFTTPITLKFKVSYQMCQEKPQEMCFPPDEKTVNVIVKQPFAVVSTSPTTTPSASPQTTAPATPAGTSSPSTTNPSDVSSVTTEETEKTPDVSSSQAPVDAVKPTVEPVNAAPSIPASPKKLISTDWKVLLPLSLIILAICVFMWFSKFMSDDDSLGVKFAKAAVVLFFLIGAFMFMKGLDSKYFPAPQPQSQTEKPALQWIPDLEAGKALASKEKKQLLIDTAAEWCAACKELEEYTFSNPDVAKVMQSYVLVRIDFTTKTEENEKLRQDLKIIGMPTLILLDSEGKEIRRDSGFMDKDKFLGFLGSNSGWFDKLLNLLKNELEKKSLLLFLLVFGLGFLTSLTPCVYPVIPIIMGYIGSRGSQGKLKSFYLSLFFVLGLATIYSILGVAAAMTGSMMGVSFQNPIVVIVISAIFMVMGLSLAGLFEIPVPSSISSKVQSSGNKGQIAGAIIVGGVAGIIAAPCVGPVLIALLSWISQTKNLFMGFWLTFIFSLGMGVIFLLAGTFSGVISSLPKGGSWMNVVKYFFALLLIAGGIYILNSIVPVWVMFLLWGIFLITVGIFMGLFAPWDEEIQFKQKFYRFIVLLIFLNGAYLLFKSLSILI